jgi:hypothetical protein
MVEISKLIKPLVVVKIVITLLAFSTITLGNSVESVKVPDENAAALELMTVKIQLMQSRLETLYERFLRTPDAVAILKVAEQIQRDYRAAAAEAFKAADVSPEGYQLNLDDMIFTPLVEGTAP